MSNPIYTRKCAVLRRGQEQYIEGCIEEQCIGHVIVNLFDDAFKWSKVEADGLKVMALSYVSVRDIDDQ